MLGWRVEWLARDAEDMKPGSQTMDGMRPPATTATVHRAVAAALGPGNVPDKARISREPVPTGNVPVRVRLNMSAALNCLCSLAVCLALAIELSTLALAEGMREQCEAVAAEHTWGPVEKNAWSAICVNPSSDTIQLDQSLIDKDLSATFVVDLALDPTVTPLLPRHGLEFSNVTLTGDLNLSYASIDIPLRFINSRFLGQVELSGSRLSHVFIIEHSTIAGRFRAVGTSFAKLVFKNNILGIDPTLEGAGSINLANAMLGGDFAELGGNKATSLYLNGSNTSGELFLPGTIANGSIYLVAATIGRGLSLEGAHVCSKDSVESVSLVRASVGDSLTLSAMTPSTLTANAQPIRTKLCSRITMAGAQIKGRVLIENAQLADVDLRTATIGGDVSVSRSTLKGKLDLSAAVVARNVHMDWARLCPPSVHDESLSLVRAAVGDSVYLTSAEVCSAIGMARSRINGQVDLSGAQVGKVDLSAATVGRELILARINSPTRWNEKGSINLSDAEVGAIVDNGAAWPRDISVHGFRYGQWKPIEQAADLGDRVDWLLQNWLPKGERFDVQPYEQLRSVLGRMFLLDTADAVKFQQWEELRERVDNPRYFAWTLARWTTGYGTSGGFVWLLYLIGLATFVGMLVVSRAEELKKKTLFGCYTTGLMYSFQRLLPFASFVDFTPDEVASGTWRRYYFVFHALVGYILAGYATASLVLLTNWNS
jgi:hypothetical protein